jgi:predicted nucleic acid-binding protein
VTEADLGRALAIEDGDLDPNDRLHLGTCLNNEIGVVLTADRAYDAAAGIERVDPLDPVAVERLLAAGLG